MTMYCLQRRMYGYWNMGRFRSALRLTCTWLSVGKLFGVLWPRGKRMDLRIMPIWWVNEEPLWQHLMFFFCILHGLLTGFDSKSTSLITERTVFPDDDWEAPALTVTLDLIMVSIGSCYGVYSYLG